jgi:FKBP-type peptidyl-prolyl cis-trans isomerase FkpA
VKKITMLLAVVLGAVALATPPPADAKKLDAKKAPEAAKPPEKKPLTPDEVKKALYVFGTFIAQRTPLAAADLSADELEVVLKGFTAAALGKPLDVKLEEAGPKVDQLLKERQVARGELEKKKGVEYLAKMAAEPGATKTPSGLIYFETKAGEGASPTPADKVKVNYRGTLVNGTEFDSSYKRNQPAEFPLGNVIKCWTEGVGKMKVGGKSKLVCPAEIAYGDHGMGSAIPPNAALTFEVELLEIVAAPPPPAANPVMPAQPTGAPQ